MQSTSEASVVDELVTDVKQEVRLARRCFAQIDRLTNLMMSYPPGHPIVEEAANVTVQSFREFFEHNDRLSVLVDAHSMKYLGTEERVWETEDPRDYSWALSRDGVYLLHILAGIDQNELRTFVEVLNQLVDERDLSKDAVSILFEAGFRYISYDAIDESLAKLAGLEVDIRDRDTKEEQELIEELFEEAFDKEQQNNMTPEQARQKQQEEFQLRMQKRSERQQRMELGSRQFLDLSAEAQEHLRELKRGFTEHAELEHREGEILAAILGARPKEKLRHQSIDQIGEVMGTLLETQHPWESLEFLKLIHEWRDKFDGPVTGELKSVVAECFTGRRLALMIKMVATAPPDVRRAILQMFNALHLGPASTELVRLLAWDIPEDVEKDVKRFLMERSKYGVGFLKQAIFEVPAEKAKPLVEIAVARMPKSKDVILEIITQPAEPEIKVMALRSMSGHWDSPDQAAELLTPLLTASHEGIRIAALRGLADANPSKLFPLLSGMLNNQLAKKSENEAKQIALLFLQLGGAQALVEMKELIHKRGVVSESDRDLAVLLAKLIARNPQPGVVELLTEVANDWLVPGKIKSTCKELSDLLTR